MYAQRGERSPLPLDGCRKKGKSVPWTLGSKSVRRVSTFPGCSEQCDKWGFQNLTGPMGTTVGENAALSPFPKHLLLDRFPS